MKYKKQIATGALALSLLVGGSNVFAATTKDLGIKGAYPTYQKQNKVLKTAKGNTAVGTVSSLSSIGFTLDVKNMKTQVTTSVEVDTSASTVYKKDGVNATSSDLAVGQKVVVSGSLDKVTNIMTAKTVRITTKIPSTMKAKKSLTKTTKK